MRIPAATVGTSALLLATRLLWMAPANASMSWNSKCRGLAFGGGCSNNRNTNMTTTITTTTTTDDNNSEYWGSSESDNDNPAADQPPEWVSFLMRSSSRMIKTAVKNMSDKGLESPLRSKRASAFFSSNNPPQQIPFFKDNHFSSYSTRMKELLERGRASWRDMDAIEFFAERCLSEESATAVKAIRTMLTRRTEDYGVVDIFHLYPAKDVAASLFALSRLQRAGRLYEQRIQQQKLNNNQYHQQQVDPDLLPLLQDLSHYAAYSTAAYGWAMHLALKGRLNRGDEQTLLRSTGISKEDVLYVNWKSKTHLPAFFVARDPQRHAVVLSIRGSWSAQDVLTDLCCTAEEYELPTNSSSPTSSYLSLPSWKHWKGRKNDDTHTVSGHHGMLEAAMAVGSMVEDLIAQELEAHPDYSLVLVGHSMGGGVAALLHSVWRTKFPSARAYLYGAPCVAPMPATNQSSVISVISEGDPFRCLSIGHIADLTAAIAHLCEETELRRAVLTNTDGPLQDLHEEDLEWCWRTMQRFRKNFMTSDNKMFPPGRIFYISKLKDANGDEESSSDNEPTEETGSSRSHAHYLREVKADFFHELVLCPKMFDISRHLPSLYESLLQELVEDELSKDDEYIVDFDNSPLSD